MPEVSVVVSIHKVADYLSDCLESIIAQTFKDIEILCIVNDSPDHCEKIARSYEWDPRIRVIVKNQAGGLGGARNCGIQESVGKYILFVDGDDALSENYIHLLYDATRQSPPIDIVYTPNIVVFRDSPDTTEKKILLNLPTREKEEGFDSLQQTFESKAEQASKSPWGYSTANKLFRKQFLLEKNLEFPKYKLHEDGVFSLCAWILSDNVLFLSSSKNLFYFYRKHPRSITASKKNGFFDAYETFLGMWTHPQISEQRKSWNSEIEKLVHLLALQWIFGISCHELRDFGWLLHPKHLLSSTQMEKNLYVSSIPLSISKSTNPQLFRILSFFQVQNPLSWKYPLRKIGKILQQNQNKTLRAYQDTLLWTEAMKFEQ